MVSYLEVESVKSKPGKPNKVSVSINATLIVSIVGVVLGAIIGVVSVAINIYNRRQGQSFREFVRGVCHRAPAQDPENPNSETENFRLRNLTQEEQNAHNAGNINCFVY